ncbi:alpha/beta-hydrolase [Flammula alnicola]|nr:alpha/beta-hydrolase [Flammula alnicola]
MSTTTTTSNAWPGLPSNITSRIIPVNDLDIHILEALPASWNPSSESKPPLLVLLHGFPELAYSWRRIMAPLAANGYAIIAPDQRGFGQTKERGRPVRKIAFEEDLAPYRMLNMVADVVALVYTLGYTSVAAVVGHDYGSPVAAHCALIRPDLFKSVVLMSAPFSGPPSLSNVGNPSTDSPLHAFNDQLAKLDPPRKHYMMYSSTPSAAEDFSNPPEGLHAFLRTYYHMKSADWKANKAARPLDAFSPAALSVMPNYYIMPLSQTMPECVAPEAPSPDEIASNAWLPDDDLAVYVSQYTETGFQGGLNLYRCGTDPLRWSKDLHVFVGKQIEVPAMFIAGAQDWGVFQMPGAAEAMRRKACRDMKDEDFVLVDGAGHWVQQEKPEAVVKHLLRFIKKSDS